jgi:hypothetical protein
MGMRSTLLALLLLAASALAAPRESYVYVHHGQSITNGAPVSVKAIKARYGTSFFWFTHGGKTHVVRDAAALRQVRAVYAPLFDDDGRTPEEKNRQIESQLRVLAEKFVKSAQH